MRAAAPRLLGAAAYGALAVTALTTLYDPLPDLPIGVGLALLVLPTLGIGLVAARWWAPLVPFAVALAWAIRGGDKTNALSTRLETLDLLALGAMAGAVTLAGVLLATASAPLVARRRRPAAAVGAILLALTLVPLTWATVRHARPLDSSPADALAVDARRGAVAGVGLGDSEQAVRKRFGTATTSPTASIAPVGEDFASLGAPPVIATPGETHGVLRYRGASFLVSDGSVYAIVLTADDAETREGVGVGDNLAVARDAYPTLRCATGEAEHRRTFPYCTGRLAGARWAWFGDDPIRSITLAATEL